MRHAVATGSAAVERAAAVSTSASPPGTVGTSRPDSLVRPRLASGATEVTVRPRRTALRRRRKRIGDSSSASKPTRTTARAFSRSAYVTPMPVPATRAARNASSSDEPARARMSTSLLPSTTRANFA